LNVCGFATSMFDPVLGLGAFASTSAPSIAPFITSLDNTWSYAIILAGCFWYC